MKLYALYIHDARYSTPNLYMVTVADDDRARELAWERLLSCEYYQLLEVFEDDRRVCALTRDPAPSFGA